MWSRTSVDRSLKKIDSSSDVCLNHEADVAFLLLRGGISRRRSLTVNSDVASNTARQTSNTYFNEALIFLYSSFQETSKPAVLFDLIARKHTTAMSDNDTTFPSVRVKCRLRPNQSSINQRCMAYEDSSLSHDKDLCTIQMGSPRHKGA